jgi:hypothetical protein
MSCDQFAVNVFNLPDLSHRDWYCRACRFSDSHSNEYNSLCFRTLVGSAAGHLMYMILDDLIPDPVATVLVRRRRLHPTHVIRRRISIIVTIMLKNTSAKENRDGKETTRNVNETESEG